jgi:hypothetical protein
MMNADAQTAEHVRPDAPLVTLTERAIAKVHSALEDASVGVRLTVGREKEASPTSSMLSPPIRSTA